ncbi:unnamed protein product [Danaus chrysippus]|uniref:(African queen) hypothetical protein n=1 Tax=Danaus chrysippus TaxID=151541 RepID=A0A8J2QMR2_9NEOP|nr:unnamed protein product [Danaus chrysippus]
MSFLKSICIYIRILIDKTIDFIFSLYWEGKKQVIPDLEKRHAFLAESATSLARKIKNKELKSETLIQAMIERMKQVNPLLNAVVADMYDTALEEAKEIDRQIAQGLSEEMANKPFLGVPFTTKESQGLKGMPTTMGLWCRRNDRATEDSEAVIRLKKAGAIALATTNLPELLIWQETRNPVYGQTNNPHHTGRSPGGSSGAEAALSATYATAISLCSFYRTGEEDSMYCLGFISKHVEDLAPLIKIVAGDKAELLKLDRNVDCKDIKFYYLESSNDCHISPIQPEIKDAMHKVIKKLQEDFNTTVEPYHHPGFDSMYSLWAHMMAKEPGDFTTMLVDGKDRVNGFKELGKKMLGMSKFCLFTILRVLEMQVLPAPNKEWAETTINSMKEDLFSKLGSSGVLLLPSSPTAAPYHYSPVLRPYNFSYWGHVNTLKCPATQVPLGRNSAGLPIGIQILAAPYNDALCLSVAKYLEKEFGGAIMACDIKK